MSSRRALVAAACLVQALLVGVAVAPQLSARTTGEEYRLAVAPLDPIDPFRGAYVVLDYPGLPLRQDGRRPLDGAVFIPLRAVGGDLWEGGALTSSRPSQGPFLRCASDGFQVDCGIESLFASQDEARRLEQELVTGAVAVLKVDGRGNAAVTEVEPARP